MFTEVRTQTASTRLKSFIAETLRKPVEMAALEWVAWFNNQRLLISIGYFSPAEAEENHYKQQSFKAVECQPLKPINLLETRGNSYCVVESLAKPN